MNKTEDIGGLRWKTVDAVKLEGKRELAKDIVGIFNQFHREGDTATLNMILDHIQENDLLPKAIADAVAKP